MAPVDAVKNIWEKTGWKKDDVDLYELNEAFSVQALGVMRELWLDPNKVNVNGGAVAIGHPIGASGARVLVTLIYEMTRRNANVESLRCAWAEATPWPWRWKEISRTLALEEPEQPPRSVTVNTAPPPGALAASIVPLCSFITDLQMLSPRPVPRPGRFVV